MSHDEFDPFQRPKNKKNLSLSSEVLQSLFENGKTSLSHQFLRWKLWAKWSDVTGKTIAENTEPVGYSRGVLYIWVRSSTLMHHLQFIKDNIKVKVNEFAGFNYIYEVRFTLDRRSVPAGEQQQSLKEAVSKIAPANEDDF
jgi:predicted nucleic acid-binding Zn ribbon protein